ncbi:MAG: uroporphyrinogen-III synthase, partial [Albidovulum sp.]|uniref:uroporphyrinogen-III synthase n=1 Tax=Albidovulum sp. TaxID=1872424 RepID=UPI003C8A7591
PMVMYDQVECPPSEAASNAARGAEPLLLPLFSPLSARRATEAFPDLTAPLFIAAISPSVADAAARLPAKRLEVAAQPDAGAMFDTLAGLIATSDIP